MTQKQLIKEYCKRNGKIIPAKLREAERAIAGGWLGSETIRRCQELAESGELYRWPNEGRFAVYSLVPVPTTQGSPNPAPRTTVHSYRDIKEREADDRVRKWQEQFKPKEKQTNPTLF